MERLSRYTCPPMKGLTILLAFSIPVSVALDNLLLALILFLGLLGANSAIALRLAGNPVVRAAWLLFGMLFIATLYGTTPWREALSTLAKYDDLAFVPLLMMALCQNKQGHYAMLMFLLAMAVTMVLSCLVGWGVIGIYHWMWYAIKPDNPAIFHSSITQNILMSYAVYISLLYVREAHSPWKRSALLLFALGGIVDIVFLVTGRTGYLVLFALLIFLAWRMASEMLLRKKQKIGGREIAIGVLVSLGIVWGAYQASDRMQQRVGEVVSEFKAWQPNVPSATANGTSTGERLTYYYNTLQIIHAHPFLGVGTGGFPDAYAKQVAGMNFVLTNNPHNEYLLMLAQGGVLALALMLYWLYAQWRQAPKLEDRFRRDAARGLVIVIAISCLVNSSLLDHTEGLFFAFMSALLFANLRKAQ